MNFFRSMLSENGDVSFGRVGSGVALVAILVWGSWICYQKKEMPPLEGPTFFITSLFGVSKLISKGAEVATTISNNNKAPIS